MRRKVGFSTLNLPLFFCRTGQQTTLGKHKPSNGRSLSFWIFLISDLWSRGGRQGQAMEWGQGESIKGKRLRFRYLAGFWGDGGGGEGDCLRQWGEVFTQKVVFLVLLGEEGESEAKKRERRMVWRTEGRNTNPHAKVRAGGKLAVWSHGPWNNSGWCRYLSFSPMSLLPLDSPRAVHT